MDISMQAMGRLGHWLVPAQTASLLQCWLLSCFRAKIHLTALGMVLNDILMLAFCMDFGSGLGWEFL